MFVSRRRPGRTSAAFPPSRCHLHLLSLSLFSVQRTSVKPDRPISEAHAEPTTVSYRTHAHTHSLAQAHAGPPRSLSLTPLFPPCAFAFPSGTRTRIGRRTPLEHTAWTFRHRYSTYNITDWTCTMFRYTISVHVFNSNWGTCRKPRVNRQRAREMQPMQRAQIRYTQYGTR